MEFDWRTLLSAVSAAAPAYAEYRATRQRSDEIQRGVNEQNRLQREADQRIQDEIGATRRSSPARLEAQNLAAYQQAIQAARRRNNASGVSGVQLGEKYEAAQGGEQAASRAYGGRIADYASRIDAPVRQRQLDAQRGSRVGLDLEGLAGTSRMQQFLTELRLRQIRANPWADVLARLGKSIANNYETAGEDMGGLGDGLHEIDLSTLPVRRTV